MAKSMTGSGEDIHDSAVRNIPPPSVVDRYAALIQTLGFPVVVSCALLGAAWLLGTKLVTSHQQLVDSLSSENKRHGDILQTMADNQVATNKTLTLMEARFVDNQRLLLDNQRLVGKALARHFESEEQEAEKASPPE